MSKSLCSALLISLLASASVLAGLLSLLTSVAGLPEVDAAGAGE